MKFAFIVYNGLTLLDFAGIYDPVTRLKTMGLLDDFEYDVCAMQEMVKAFEGVEIKADKVSPSLADYDYIFVPGGNGILALLSDKSFITWIKGVSEKTIVTAVCGGALALGVAGFLNGKRATTHPMLMPYLSRFTDNPSDLRIVDEGSVVTARGVTSSIDLGLYLCEKIAGKEVREKIQSQMDYLSFCIE